MKKVNKRNNNNLDSRLRGNDIRKKPLVSVVMPVYNAGDYLVPAIESILNQSYFNYELIIVNDASTDDSLMVIDSYRRMFPDKITVINLVDNLNKGGDSCANLAIEKSKGKYIAKMDADDIAHPDRIRLQVQYLEKHPKTFLVGSQAYVIDKYGDIIGDKTEPSTHKEIYKSYLTFHPIIHPTAMFRRMKNKKEAFKYKIKYSANNDYYTFFGLICERYKFANLKEKLLYYRIHGKNDTFVNIKNKFMNTLKIRLLMIGKYGYKPTLKQILTGLIQAITLILLPEKFTAYLYLMTKGIIKKEDVVKDILDFWKTLVPRLQHEQV